ncbi:MAG: ABC transporter substrate-binding protein [Chloroflexota bacterium]
MAIQPIVIGAILTLGEDALPAGTGRYEAAMLAVELVNQRGGVRLPGGDRRPLELRVFDDDGNPDRAALSLQRLDESGALAVIGPSTPEAVLTSQSEAEAAQIPLVVLTSTGPDTARAGRWTFAVAAPADEALAAIIDFFTASGVDRFAWMAPRTLEATALTRTVRQRAAGAGMQIVGEEAYPPGETEYAEQLARLQTGDPRVILAWVHDAHEAADIAIDARTVPGLVPVFFGPVAAAPSMLADAGEAGNGVRTVTLRLPVADDLWDHDALTPVIRDFRREMQAKTGRMPTAEAAGAWDAVQVVVQAIEKVGTDRTAVRDAIEATTDHVGASGLVSFGPRRHAGLDKRAYIVARGEEQRWRLPP